MRTPISSGSRLDLLHAEMSKLLVLITSLPSPQLWKLSTVKVLLALAATWGVPTKYGDVPNAYVKANKESHLEILLQIPQGMDIEQETMKDFGMSSKTELSLELCNARASRRLADYEVASSRKVVRCGLYTVHV